MQRINLAGPGQESQVLHSAQPSSLQKWAQAGAIFLSAVGSFVFARSVGFFSGTENADEGKSYSNTRVNHMSGMTTVSNQTEKLVEGLAPSVNLVQERAFYGIPTQLTVPHFSLEQFPVSQIGTAMFAMLAARDFGSGSLPFVFFSGIPFVAGDGSLTETVPSYQRVPPTQTTYDPTGEVEAYGTSRIGRGVGIVTVINDFLTIKTKTESAGQVILQGARRQEKEEFQKEFGTIPQFLFPSNASVHFVENIYMQEKMNEKYGKPLDFWEKEMTDKLIWDEVSKSSDFSRSMKEKQLYIARYQAMRSHYPDEFAPIPDDSIQNYEEVDFIKNQYNNYVKANNEGFLNKMQTALFPSRQEAFYATQMSIDPALTKTTDQLEQSYEGYDQTNGFVEVYPKEAENNPVLKQVFERTANNFRNSGDGPLNPLDFRLSMVEELSGAASLVGQGKITEAQYIEALSQQFDSLSTFEAQFGHFSNQDDQQLENLKSENPEFFQKMELVSQKAGALKWQIMSEGMSSIKGGVQVNPKDLPESSNNIRESIGESISEIRNEISDLAAEQTQIIKVSEYLIEKSLDLNSQGLTYVNNVQNKLTELSKLEQENTDSDAISKKKVELDGEIKRARQYQAKNQETFNDVQMGVQTGIQALGLIGQFSNNQKTQELTSDIATFGSAALSIGTGIAMMTGAIAAGPAAPFFAISGGVMTLMGLFGRKKAPPNDIAMIANHVLDVSLNALEQVNQGMHMRFDRIETLSIKLHETSEQNADKRTERLANLSKDLYEKMEKVAGARHKQLVELQASGFEMTEQRFDRLEKITVFLFENMGKQMVFLFNKEAERDKQILEFQTKLISDVFEDLQSTTIQLFEHSNTLNQKRFEQVFGMLSSIHRQTFEQFKEIAQGIDNLHSGVVQVQERLENMKENFDTNFASIQIQLDDTKEREYQRERNYALNRGFFTEGRYKNSDSNEMPDVLVQLFLYFVDRALVDSKKSFLPPGKEGEIAIRQKFSKLAVRGDQWQVVSESTFLFQQYATIEKRVLKSQVNPKMWADSVLTLMEFVFRSPDFVVEKQQKKFFKSLRDAGDSFSTAVRDLQQNEHFFSKLFNDYRFAVQAFQKSLKDYLDQQKNVEVKITIANSEKLPPQVRQKTIQASLDKLHDKGLQVFDGQLGSVMHLKNNGIQVVLTSGQESSYLADIPDAPRIKAIYGSEIMVQGSNSLFFVDLEKGEQSRDILGTFSEALMVNRNMVLTYSFLDPNITIWRSLKNGFESVGKIDVSGFKKVIPFSENSCVLISLDFRAFLIDLENIQTQPQLLAEGCVKTFDLADKVILVSPWKKQHIVVDKITGTAEEVSHNQEFISWEKINENSYCGIGVSNISVFQLNDSVLGTSEITSKKVINSLFPVSEDKLAVLTNTKKHVNVLSRDAKTVPDKESFQQSQPIEDIRMLSGNRLLIQTESICYIRDAKNYTVISKIDHGEPITQIEIFEDDGFVYIMTSSDTKTISWGSNSFEKLSEYPVSKIVRTESGIVLGKLVSPYTVGKTTYEKGFLVILPPNKTASKLKQFKESETVAVPFDPEMENFAYILDSQFLSGLMTQFKRQSQLKISLENIEQNRSLIFAFSYLAFRETMLTSGELSHEVDELWGEKAILKLFKNQPEEYSGEFLPFSALSGPIQESLKVAETAILNRVRAVRDGNISVDEYPLVSGVQHRINATMAIFFPDKKESDESVSDKKGKKQPELKENEKAKPHQDNSQIKNEL